MYFFKLKNKKITFYLLCAYFLLDKDISELDRISIERKKEEDCWFVNSFILRKEKNTVKEFFNSSYDFKDHENY